MTFLEMCLLIVSGIFLIASIIIWKDFNSELTSLRVEYEKLEKICDRLEEHSVYKTDRTKTLVSDLEIVRDKQNALLTHLSLVIDKEEQPPIVYKVKGTDMKK